jgi:hypothetical protein
MGRGRRAGKLEKRRRRGVKKGGKEKADGEGKFPLKYEKKRSSTTKIKAKNKRQVNRRKAEACSQPWHRLQRWGGGKNTEATAGSTNRGRKIN